MNTDPLISVIVPVYCVERFLGKCLESIIGQTYRNLEIILVNDGSTDHSGVICDQYALKDQRIKVIHKSNGGVSSARNVGLDNATGDYITFIDSDDYWDNHYIDGMLHLLRKHNADVVRCDDWTLQGNEILTEDSPRFSETFFEINDKRNFQYPYYRLSCDMLLIKSSLTKYIRFESNLKAGEDGVFVTKLILNAKNGIAYTPKRWYHIVLHSDSSRHQMNNSLLEAFYIRQQLDLPDVVYRDWAEDFAERCCIEYIALLKENDSRNKERMQKIISYIREYKMYGGHALGEGIFAKLLFRILCVSPDLFNIVYQLRYSN